MLVDSVPSHSVLLNFPREVRDLIYGYLHEPLNFSYKFPEMLTTVTVEVPRAPTSIVLRTCSRLCSEYFSSSVYEKLTAVVHFDMWQEEFNADATVSFPDSSMPRLAATESDMKADATFARLRIIVLLYNYPRSDNDAGSNLRSRLNSTQKALTTLCPSLCSVKIGIKRYRESATAFGNGSQNRAEVYLSKNKPTSFPARREFCNFPIQQSSVCYRLGQETRTTYTIYQLDLTLYANEARLLWTRKQAKAACPIFFEKAVETELIALCLPTNEAQSAEYLCPLTNVMGWQELVGSELDGYMEQLKGHATKLI
jgi:hypothetical protein